jgi:hypothetical protein
MENTLDAIAVADSDLDMRPFMKTACRIDRIAFEEDAAYRIERLDDALVCGYGLDRGVKVPDHGTVRNRNTRSGSVMPAGLRFSGSATPAASCSLRKEA